MENNHRFFANIECKYYPCHVYDIEQEGFNCLFCFCPMSRFEDCLGEPKYMKGSSGATIKDCSGCQFPHHPGNYDLIMEFLKNHSC